MHMTLILPCYKSADWCKNELISRANIWSKTWVKYFHVFALAQHLCPSAQWTKSLSDTNNPPTHHSAASLERCQVHWVYVVRGDPGVAWLTCWSLWSPLLTMALLLPGQLVQYIMVKQQADTQELTRTVSLPHQWLLTGCETDYNLKWSEQFSVNYRLLFFHLSLFLSECMCQKE